MMLSPGGDAAVRSGRKESWGAILRARLVRAVVLWPRLGVRGVRRAVVRSWATGRARERRSMVAFSKAVPTLLVGLRIGRLTERVNRWNEV